MADSPNSSVAGLRTVAEREALLLAPYALKSADSAGRAHPEAEHPYRGPFQRDRDRILHSAAFRRLSGKMQVFTGDMGDYHRTRLTHTHEVASIARTVARALCLNEDLVEALALFHDIGHPPFGHSGEDALNKCLAKEGGFSHNRHALVIAEELERRYPNFPGLNLSREVLDSQTTRIDKQAKNQRPWLEAQLVDAADSTTYDAHDTDDAVKLGLVTLDELAENSLIADCLARVRQRYTSIDGSMLRKTAVHELIDRQVGDLLTRCGIELRRRAFQSAEEARNSDFVIGPSDELSEQKAELEAFLFQRVYRHPKLGSVRHDAQNRIQVMFDGFQQRPELLPPKNRARESEVGLARAVGEFIAGMTDRYCDDQFHRHFPSK